MRSPLFPTTIACVLALTTLCAAAETREEKVDRLFRFFNMDETGDYGMKVMALRVRTAAKQASDEAIAGLPAATREKGTNAITDALVALEKALGSIESTPTADVWKSFLTEQLSEEDLDKAVAYFSSPSGGRFMGTKGVADTILSRATQRRFQEAVGPAAEALQTTLKTLATR